MRIRDRAGLPIAGTGLRRPLPERSGRTAEDHPRWLASSRPDKQKGLYDSGKVDLAPRSSRAMVAAAGYRTFDGNVNLTHSIERGTAILAFDLDRE